MNNNYPVGSKESLEFEGVKPIISKPITQTQLDLCRAALNIAAGQCNLTATLVMGRKEQRTAEHFAPGPAN